MDLTKPPSTHKGSCYCGQIAFEVDETLNKLYVCNCNACRKKGTLIWLVAQQSLKLLTPIEALSAYTNSSKNIKHHFCPNCGIHTFATGMIKRNGKTFTSINARCLDSIDFNTIATHTASKIVHELENS